MLISKFKKQTKKPLFIKILMRIKCFIGFHAYRKKHRYTTYVMGADSRGIPRRSKAEVHICKDCGKEKIIVDIYNSYL